MITLNKKQAVLVLWIIVVLFMLVIGAPFS